MKSTRSVSHRFVTPFVALAAVLAAAGAAPNASAQVKSNFTYNGMDYTSYQATEYLEMPQGPDGAADLRATGANYTAVMATWYVQTYDSTAIAPETSSTPGYNSSADPLSPTDAAVVAAIHNLQAQGITVTLKPHVDSIDGIWRGDFTWPATATTTAEQQAWLTAWFTSYQAFILHFAQIASENNVGVLVIGTEFAKLSGSDCAGSCRSYWDQYVINPLRANYPNLTLVYGANATSAGDEFTSVSFWDDIDIIGVDGYFPLTNHADPTTVQLTAAWTTAAGNKNGFDPEQALQNLQSAHPTKPLIFTELGYVSAAGTNEEPYSGTPSPGTYDPTEQEDCYEAFFEVFSTETAWMKGVFWWEWSVSPPGSGDTGYSPQTKAAGTTTLPEWYGSTEAGFTLAPSLPAMFLGAGLSSADTISVTALGGFTGGVSLGVSGLPSGVTGAFSAGTVAGTQVLTLTAGSGATVGGPVTVTVTGTSGALTADTIIALTVIAPATQTITFANPGDQEEGTQLTLTATASSGLPVSFASSTMSVCTVNDSTQSATLLTTGACTITATQAGNGIYAAAAAVSQSFTVTALPPAAIPANAKVIVSQLNWLDALTGYVQTSNNPTGGSFAVNANGQLAVADTDNLYLIDTQTGVTAKLGAWAGASAIAIDSKNNIYVGSLYGSPESIVKLPYLDSSSNGGYAAFTTPTTGTAACTATSATECLVSHAGSVYPEAMGFDAAGDLFWITSSDGVSGGNGIWECTAACLNGTGSPVQLYQEPTASPAPSTSSGQLIAGGLAIDSAGNVFFTDSSSYVNTTSYAYTSFYSNLKELPTSTGAGYGGKTTGYAASPVDLYTLTPSTIGAYNNQLDGVAVLRNPTRGDTVYFADQSDGIFGFPDTSGGIPLANGQPTALYSVSTQGAKTLTLDSQGNLCLAASATVLNTSGADTLAQLALDRVMLPSSAAGTAGSTPTFSSSNGITSGQVFAAVNDGVSTPSISVTASEYGKSTGEFSATAGASIGNSLTTGAAFPLTVTFTPAKVGERSAVLTVADTASGGGSSMATATGVGQGPLVTLDPGVWTSYPASPGIGFGAGNAIRVDAAGDIFEGDGADLFEIPAGSPAPVTPTKVASGFSSISDMAFDANGNLYLADSTNQEVYEIPNINGSLVPASQTTVVSRSTTFGGAPVNTPSALAVGPDGVLYIGDNGTGQVDTYNPGNGVTGVRAPGLSGNLAKIAVDAAGNLYIATSGSNGAQESGSLNVYLEGGAVTIVPLGNIIPGGIAVDPSDSVLIPDQTTGDIVRIPSVSGTLTAGNAITIEKLTGAAGAIALDASGNLYANDGGNGAVYAIQRTAAALTFVTPVADGSSSSPLTLYAEDAGNLALNVSSAGATGDFSQTNNCTGAINAGAVCAVNVTFTPTQTGTRTGLLSIADNAPGSPHTAALTGTGVVLTISLSPTTLTFASTPEGSTSAAQTVTVKNTGTAAVTLTSETLTGTNVSSYLISANTCGASLAVNATCAVSIEFKPVAAGTLTASLSVADNATGSPQTVSLTGTGAAASPTGALQFIPVTPCRIADTRNATGAFGGPELAAQATRTFNVPQSACSIPSAAVAYSLNVTVVPGASLGYLTMWPAGEAQPTVSTLNSDGRVKANATITPAGTNGGVSVFVTDATQFILDIDGYFVPAGTSSSGLEFYPVTPCRVADTRNAAGPLGGPALAANGSRAFPVQSSSCGIPATAKAYSLNITAVPRGPLGFLTAWPSGQAQPVVSTLNSSTGTVVANAAIVPAGAGGDVSIFVSDAADAILDVNGYFAPPATGGLSLYTVTPCRALDTRGGAGAFNGTLTVPIHASACAPPTTAQAYVLNATVIPTTTLSYLTLWAAGGTQPGVSTLNAGDGAVTSNMAIVPTTNGSVDAFATNSTQLILDISSYFAP